MAKKKPEFRSFALKAMAAMDQSASLLKLRALMSVSRRSNSAMGRI